MTPLAKRWRSEVLDRLADIERTTGGQHLPHEGRDWSACLQCRIDRLRRDVKDGVILMPISRNENNSIKD